MTVVHTKISKISFSNDSIVILTQFVIHENQRTAYEIEIRKRIEVNPARGYEIWSMNEHKSWVWFRRQNYKLNMSFKSDVYVLLRALIVIVNYFSRAVRIKN